MCPTQIHTTHAYDTYTCEYNFVNNLGGHGLEFHVRSVTPRSEPHSVPSVSGNVYLFIRALMK